MICSYQLWTAAALERLGCSQPLFAEGESVLFCVDHHVSNRWHLQMHNVDSARCKFYASEVWCRI